jgi:hypothetical protein
MPDVVELYLFSQQCPVGQHKMSRHLFNSSGEWIAFRNEKFVFDTRGNWVGWLPWDDEEVVDKNGSYLGHIYGNRLLRRYYTPYRGFPGYPGYPGYPGFPGYPGYAGYAPLPPGTTDVDLDEVNK